MGKHGLAYDNMVGAEVVTAEGKTVRASAEENPDLLWGLRGQSMFDQGYPSGLYHYWKSSFMNTLPDEAIDADVEQFTRRTSPLTHLVLEHMHGAASRVPPTATAFAHRFDHYNLSGFGIWADPKDADANLRWVEGFWRAVRPFLSGRAYVNYLGQEGASRVREAYGPNYDRLAALKKKYDPTNFFRSNQNIPPNGSSEPVT